MKGGRRGPKVLGEDSVTVGFKLPAVLTAVLHDAAKANYESPANYVRRAVIAQLRADDFLKTGPPETATPEAIERQLAAVKAAMDGAGLGVRDGRVVKVDEP